MTSSLCIYDMEFTGLVDTSTSYGENQRVKFCPRDAHVQDWFVAILKELAAGNVRNRACSPARRAPEHDWELEAKYRGVETSDLARSRQLEVGNAQMRGIIARKELELDAARNLIENNGWGPRSARPREGAARPRSLTAPRTVKVLASQRPRFGCVDCW